MYDPEPSIPDMQDMLRRPVGVDSHPLVSKKERCESCGTESADWWLKMSGTTQCNRCAVVDEKLRLINNRHTRV